MEIIAFLLVCALAFGLCFLVDKGFTRVFRNRRQQKSGLSVHLAKGYALAGLLITVLGIALGQVLGKYLCTYLVSTVEMDIVMFGRQALPQNYIVSVLMSVGFAVLVNVLMYFRMKKIDMVESLKSVE